MRELEHLLGPVTKAGNPLTLCVNAAPNESYSPAKRGGCHNGFAIKTSDILG